MRYTPLIWAVFAFIAYPQAANSVSPPPLDTPVQIEAYVQEQASLSHLDGLYETLRAESAGWKNEQSEILNPKGPNGRENSWGVCQINLDPTGHPDITKEEAMDPRWCISWTIEQFREGHASMWTAYRLYKAGKLESPS